jgi:hypothetical protein
MPVIWPSAGTVALIVAGAALSDRERLDSPPGRFAREEALQRMALAGDRPRASANRA